MVRVPRDYLLLIVSSICEKVLSLFAADIRICISEKCNPIHPLFIYLQGVITCVSLISDDNTYFTRTMNLCKPRNDAIIDGRILLLFLTLLRRK